MVIEVEEWGRSKLKLDLASCGLFDISGIHRQALNHVVLHVMLTAFNTNEFSCILSTVPAEFL